jgi:hypothetical protein
MGRKRDILDAILLDADDLQAEQGTQTMAPSEGQAGAVMSVDEWAASEVASSQQILAARRRQLLSRGARSIEPAPRVEISPSLLALPREVLLARVQALCAQPREVQLAYRDLRHHSDHDLRLLITLLESPGEPSS